MIIADDVPPAPGASPAPLENDADTAPPPAEQPVPPAAAAAAAAAAKPPIYPTKQGSRPAKPPPAAAAEAEKPSAAPGAPNVPAAAAASPAPLNPNHWSADMDIALFAAIANYKPVGACGLVTRTPARPHFRMISVQRHFNCHSPRQLSTSEIWARLGQLYNLDMIEAANAYNEDDDESDSDAADRIASPDGGVRGRRSVKNPLERKADFQLPPDDFQALMTERRTNASERGVGSGSGLRDSKSHSRAVSSPPAAAAAAADSANKGKLDKASFSGAAASAANPPLSAVLDSSVASGAPAARKRKRTQALLPAATAATGAKDESDLEPESESSEDEEGKPPRVLPR
ncbi:MAG: hypothetical protein BJ554DRAFT_1345 [Olpidium bornovanus]|uniref:Uncharacterized protein n=1 Tax=Olpidium bornovanus TaxID=278681 RepID=A0A8H7ZRQ4_9FUNG|nr:MAG: hypothetical protein BJ554DRAFT_1345 [Olpidium bornovanus]